MRATTFLLFTFLSVLGFSAFAQTPQREVKNFTLVNALDNQKVSLSNYADKAAVVVIFTSNKCPYDKYYRERIKTLAGQCSKSGIPFILINSNKDDADSPSNMVKTASAAGFKMPYLIDKELKALNIFGAKKSPEAFLLENKNGKFFIAYRGAIDNNPQVASDVKENYLLNGIESVLAGKLPEKRFMRPTGCIIKKF